MHWMTPSYLDPDAWLGQYYNKAYHGAVPGSTFYYTPKVQELVEKARSMSVRRTGDLLMRRPAPHRGRCDRYLALQ